MSSLEREKKLTIFLEKASKSDVETLLELEKSVSGSSLYSPMLEGDEWKEEIKNSAVYLIKNENEIVGNFSYEQKSPEHLYISGLVVHPSHQRKGIARDVLTKFLSEHPKTTRIDLVTHPDNPALQLYQSLGFKIECRKEDYYGDGQPRIVLALTR